MLLGISTIIFEGYENIEPSELESVKKAGFDYIEVSPYHEITPKLKKFIDSIGISVLSMHADYLNTDASSEDKKIRSKTLKIYKDTLNKAKELGAKTVVIHPGTWLEYNRRKERLRRCAETFTELAIFSNKYGVKIAIENLPPGFICDNADDLHFVLESVINNSGKNCQAGICLDTGHANIGNNLFTYIKRFGSHILSMHLHDNHGDTGKDKTFAEEDLHILPGDGSVNWETFFAELDSINYENAFIFELMRENTKEKDIYKILSGVKEFLKYHEDLS